MVACKLTQLRLAQHVGLSRLGFTQIERDPDADRAPYINVDSLDPQFYDLEKTPLCEGRAPTAAEARQRSRFMHVKVATDGRNGSVKGGEGVGQVDGISGSLNFRDEVNETSGDSEMADASGVKV